MNGLLFTNPALLGGLTLLAIPILIHLLLRIKRRRLRFSTLQFFRRLDEQATRRRKVRNWLLLAVRLLLLMCVVAAFARPYLDPRGSAGKATPPQHVVVLLDRSASMGAVDPEGRRWERAKTAVQKVLSRLGASDRATLIDCAARPERLTEPTDPADVLKVLDTLALTHSTADLGKGLQETARIVANTSTIFTNTIYVVSDLQRASCANLGSYAIPQNARVEILNIGDPFAPNAAVTGLLVNADAGARPGVTVVNFSEDDLSGLTLRFSVDEKEVSSQPVHLAGGESTNIEMAMPAAGPGWHSAEARIGSRDALPEDDVCYQSFYVPPPVRLLLVEPREVAKLFQEESFFVASALDPKFGLAEAQSAGPSAPNFTSGGSPFALEKIAPGELMERLQRHNSASPYEVVVLPGLKSIAGGLPAALAKYVEVGGGLLVFLNDALSVNRYNTEFADLLPASLKKIETASELDWRLWEHDEHSPVFAPFATPNSGNLSLSKFTRRGALSLVEQAVVLARFQDGEPLMIDRAIGQGHVLLVNTSADTAWSDWPKHRTFVPWIHSLARFLAHREAPAQTGDGRAFVAGTDMELNLGSNFKQHSLRLVRPDGKETACTTDGQGWLQALDLSLSGVYSLRTAQGQELRRLAINVPPAESDLTAMSTAEFDRQVPRLEISRENSPAVALFDSRHQQSDFGPPLLLAALTLLLLELLLGNRTLA